MGTSTSTHWDENDWAVFNEKVFSRARLLIQTGIWDGIEEDHLAGWIRGFETYSNPKLASLLLDSLIYRSPTQFRSMIRNLFMESPPELDPDTLGRPLWEVFAAPTASKQVRIAPVLGLESPPDKSGPYVLRVANRIYRFPRPTMIWPQAITKMSDEVKLLLFIDDFCGTGTQFTDFLRETVKLEQLLEARPNLKVGYLVAAAHQDGLEKIKRDFPKVIVYFADRLTTDHAFLSQSHLGQFGNTEFVAEMNALYKNLSAAVGLPMPGGSGSSQYSGLQLSAPIDPSTANSPARIVVGVRNSLPTWSQTDIGHLLGVHGHYFALLRSRNKTVSLEFLCRVSFALGIPIEKLLIENSDCWLLGNPRRGPWKPATRVLVASERVNLAKRFKALARAGCPSLRMASIHLRHSRSTLIRHFPEMAKVILARSKPRYAWRGSRRPIK